MNYIFITGEMEDRQPRFRLVTLRTKYYKQPQ